MALVFIGPRGSGKSTVGAMVAGRLGRPFLDADTEIERRAGQTIREIFATDGEPAFRALEREVMAELLADRGLVVASGGGAVLSAETRGRMKRSEAVVYLRVSAETAARRVEADTSTAARRPALTNLTARDEMAAVIAAREPFYQECATVVLDADGLSAAELADAVLAAVKSEGAAT